MSSFKIRATWAPRAKAATVGDEIEASLCSLSIFLDETNITRYKTSTDKEFASLRIPAYYIAEWIAENWWPLLNEPRKGDDTDDTDESSYLSRHSLLTAEHGFALPSLHFVPTGQAVHIHAAPRKAQFADAYFGTNCFGDVSRVEVSAGLDKFVSGCIGEMLRNGISHTPLNEAWERIKNTTEAEIEFCELVGALGLCPYNISDDISAAIDLLVDTLGSGAAKDFCLAASSAELTESVGSTKAVVNLLENATKIDLSPLHSIDFPAENLTQPSWSRGFGAALRIASALNVQPSDPSGADRVFDRLHVDTQQAVIQSNKGGRFPFVGVVDRNDADAQMVLTQEKEGDRRFAAARAIYLALVSEGKSRRLITKTHTRDQQASRQFAAEILVPREYLRSISVGAALNYEQVREIARIRRASPSAVYHQASNMGLTVYE